MTGVLPTLPVPVQEVQTLLLYIPQEDWAYIRGKQNVVGESVELARSRGLYDEKGRVYGYIKLCYVMLQVCKDNEGIMPLSILVSGFADFWAEDAIVVGSEAYYLGGQAARGAGPYRYDSSRHWPR